MLVEAIGAGAVGEDSQTMMIAVVTGAITKIQKDARSAWAFVHANAGLDELDETDLSYNWPKGLFSLAEPLTEAEGVETFYPMDKYSMAAIPTEATATAIRGAVGQIG